MAGTSDILRRFRPVAAPGAPGRRGVPVDRVEARDAELAPLFALLADVELEAAATRSAAAGRAAAITAAARDAAAAAGAEGRLRAAAERDRAAVALTRRAEKQGAAAVAASERAAEDLRRRSASRLPRLTELAAARIRARLAAELAAPDASIATTGPGAP
jgi:hypothetical protein